MKKYNYVKYKNGKVQHITGYSISNVVITLYLHKDSLPLVSNEGFELYSGDGALIADGSDFIYRYDVLNAENPTQPYTVSYTNDPELKQTIPYMTQEEMDIDAEYIPVDPLSNEELTEMVGGLLYENSLLKIGLSNAGEVI